MSKKGRKIYIFDTTLRDGEQSPGASLTPEEKLECARQLERLKLPELFLIISFLVADFRLDC